MSALQLAEMLEQDHDISEGDHLSVALMLRKQDAAIKQLRVALEDLERVSGLASMWDDEGRKAARAALAATEGLTDGIV